MIEISRKLQQLQPGSLRIKVLGIGGAGANALDRIMLDGLPGAELIAINTDAQSLTGSVAPEKVQIGRATTRGLGTGGDPELGYQAAEEGVDDIRAAVEDAALVFLCVGLGGGTGSGAAPLIANYAREQNALVVVFATLPFSFEGRRRMAQAEEALAALQQQADVVICFENDKMADAVDPRAGIQEAFSAADATISQSVRAIAALVSQRGLIHIGFDELMNALRAQNARCIFGCGEADGDNRAHTALERALRNPLMDRGRLLGDASSVLVNVAGGPGMTLNEVQILMDELGRHIGDSTRILFGCAVDPSLGGRMIVTILSALAAAPHPAPVIAPLRSVATGVAQPATSDARHNGSAPAEAVIGGEPEPIAQEAAPATLPPAAGSPGYSMAAAEKAARAIKQAQMLFEPVTRGRFEKSEPTIVDGEDLDVPTFLRRNIKVK